MPHQSTGEPPFLQMFGREPRLRVHFLLGQVVEPGGVQDRMTELQARLKVFFENARNRLLAAVVRRKERHDQRVQEAPLQVGQLVYPTTEPLVPLSTVETLKRKISGYLCRWMGFPHSQCSAALFGKTYKLQHPFNSFDEEFRVSHSREALIYLSKHFVGKKTLNIVLFSVCINYPLSAVSVASKSKAVRHEHSILSICLFFANQIILVTHNSIMISCMFFNVMQPHLALFSVTVCCHNFVFDKSVFFFLIHKDLHHKLYHSNIQFFTVLLFKIHNRKCC